MAALVAISVSDVAMSSYLCDAYFSSPISIHCSIEQQQAIRAVMEGGLAAHLMILLFVLFSAPQLVLCGAFCFFPLPASFVPKQLGCHVSRWCSIISLPLMLIDLTFFEIRFCVIPLSLLH